ncbi:hypothetical protein A4H97_16220 [Niastella yeongjuensis]|uniref:DUF4249 domain-containing protein n=1 Tax=Niastella yeongjuensis TaxID=354355 RepID=A0A1V9E0Y5_9BACT|nr:DUF4249 domain-containing protein [Niastella yeongjuensis]OQP39770.1 hypothetical protein A4H97_16220 [Niastella yeongjuensis]SEO04712.1 protein of unknown function [Niastella yeongjuensis]
MRYLAVIIILLIGTSCEKVVNIKLDTADKKYVVEGVLTNQSGTCMVLLSQTQDFDASNAFTGVSGAAIQITEKDGATTQLTETSAGVYQAAGLTGTTGKTYTLSVTIKGQTFLAASTMPAPVNMDSIFITEDEAPGGKRNMANVQYNDPAGVANNYRFVQYVNGEKEQEIFVRNDELTNGNLTVTKLRYPKNDDDEKDNSIKTGDLVKIDMQCIDPVIYKYWYSLSRSATGGGGNAATPANPVTNMTGGALGYFSAHTLQTKTLTVR